MCSVRTYVLYIHNVRTRVHFNATKLDHFANSISISQMKPIKEKSDEMGGKVADSDAVPQEDNQDYYSVEYAQPQMDRVDVELLERFLQMLEETSDSDDVDYDELLPKPDDNARPQNVSSGIDC